jgi:tripartite-type tricarboxylate transporter receptor subunit TctC
MKTACKMLGLFLAFAFALVCGEAAAQSYPNRPIRFVVGYPPGGGNDLLARIVSQKLAERIGQPVVVENKPGADAIIATEYMAKAAPDGYTLMVGASGAMVINPGIYDRLPYDPVKDFIPITLFASDPLMFAVHPSVPATSIQELIALARSKPGQLFYASGATPMRVATELFKKQTGVNVVHVAYKGVAPAVTAAVAGEVSLVVMSIPPALAQLRAGKLRALAVTSVKRDPLLPDTPTMLESGFNFEGDINWVGLFAPAGTPGAIIDKLYSELSVILKSESLKERYAAIGAGTSGIGLSPAEFGAFFRASLATWTKVTRDLNIRAD